MVRAMTGGEVRAGRVLIVDADDRRRRAMRHVVEGLEAVSHVEEAVSALAAADRALHVDVALVDCALPDADVVDAIRLLHRAAPTLPVIGVSAGTNPEVVRGALDAGAISFLSHTGPALTLGDAVIAALRGRGLVDPNLIRPVLNRYADLLENAHRRDRAVIESLAAAVEAKDTVTSRHLRAVSQLALKLADLVEPDLAGSDDFLYGCLLHDVGKIGVPERILAKPGPLTDAEWIVMRTHPRVGADVIRPLGLDPVVEHIVLHHHERWDGTGYPNGLSDQAIPLEARIFAVCDALEAMTAQRPYRGPLPADVAYQRVREGSGRQFDPTVVEALEQGMRDGTVELTRELEPVSSY
jgi:putative two-component system response regulator